MAVQGRTLARRTDAAWPWRPSLAPLVAGSAFSLALTVWFWHLDPRTGPLGWYASVVWTVPVVLSAQGIAGVLHLRRMQARRVSAGPVVEVVSSQQLVVVVPTLGRRDAFAALTRVLASFCRYLPTYFSCVRVDVVVEEGCETRGELLELAAANPMLHVVVVPAGYRTPSGTRFKARANHYAHLIRQRDGEARPDVWILHMDDDTSVNDYTAAEIARFTECQRAAGDDGMHLAQGVLTYPREYASNGLTWYADAVRPGCDISLFALTTGRGDPRIGLHGELLLVRASVEAQIGWDFGPRTIVEDAEFALHFCDAHPGRSAWFPACSYGASPSTVHDFIKQRERWVWGQLVLLTRSSVPLRRRLLLLPTIALWVAAPFGNPLLLVGVGLLIGDVDTTPGYLLVGVVWALNFGFYLWLYWEGLKINLYWSTAGARRWWDPFVLVAGTPVFAVMECLGIASGLVRFLSRSEVRFQVIEKPV